MRINDDHMYHGAALTQIAEHPSFTAINVFKTDDGKSRSAFKINDSIGVYLKYASRPTGAAKEYVFTFTGSHLKEIADLKAKSEKVFVVLVCIAEREICVLPVSELESLIAARTKRNKAPEAQYQALVTAPANKSFRVYMNVPGKKGQALGVRTVKRSSFPGLIFA